MSVACDIFAAMTWHTTSVLFQSADDNFPYGQFVQLYCIRLSDISSIIAV